MKTFEQFIHEQGTGGYPLSDLLYNLEAEDIEELAQEYAKEYAQNRIHNILDEINLRQAKKGL